MTAAGPVVAVWPPVARTGSRLLDALERACDVRLAGWASDGGPYAALVAVGPGGVAATGLREVPVLELGAVGGPVGAPREALLADAPAVARPLRRIALPSVASHAPLEVGPGEVVLGRCADGPAWTAADGPVLRQRVRDGLGALGPAEPLRDALRDSRALTLVALVQLLRIVRLGGWRAPATRAAFVFDDPNLHRPRYGFLHYPELLAHADRHGYHVAMALIPLDTRRTHPVAVRAFGSRPDRLSLVVHGNDHTRDELLADRSRGEALALAAESLRRIGRFERATGLQVDRVMMPPHGMCSRTMAGALGAVGYDALSAQHPCPWTEDPPADRVLAGWTPAEWVDGCAVVPRLPFTDPAAELALRVFLGQPLVLYGHHGDVAGGLEPLAEAAARVNAIGDVRWCSVGELVAGNHELRGEGADAELRPWSGRGDVALPAGTRTVTVRSPGTPSAAALRGWRGAGVAWPGDDTGARPGGATAGDLGDAGVRPGGATAGDLGDAGVLAFDAPRSVAGAGRLKLRVLPAQPVDPATLAALPARPWAQLRRVATEARDRAAPLRARL